MRILAAILIILSTGWYHAEANEKSDRTVLGSLEVLEEGSKDKYTRDNGESIRSGGNLLRSFRRTAARLQEYDGFVPNGNFKREGLNWTRGPIASRGVSEEKERSKTETRTEARTEESWGWSQDKVTIPDTAKDYMIFFTMKGCPACTTMYPVVKDLQKQGYEIYIVYQRVNPALVNDHQVTRFPTMVIYNDGKQTKRYRGVVTLKSITKYLKKPTPPNGPDRSSYDFVNGPKKYRLW